MLHSDELELYSGVLSPAIQQALLEIKQYFGVADTKILALGPWHIAVPVVYPVSLPSNGAVDGLDIRPEEPVMIQISLHNYPDFAPYILSDRKDFPKSQLSHLYFTKEKEPARLCLVRNDPNEWFADIKLTDFLAVGGQWLYKAGTGQLNEDGDEFDPTRVEGNVWAKHIYKYDTLYEVASQDQRFLPDFPMAICISGFFVKDESKSFYKSIRPVPFIAYPAVLEVVQGVTATERGTDNADNGNPLFSVLIWHPDNKVEDRYLTSLPANYGHLKLFFSLRGVDITATLRALETRGALIKCGVPIIYAMRRPRKVIGYNGDYEFFNFVLTMPADGVEHLKDDDVVTVQSHIEPFSSELASYISGRPKAKATLYIGAGSLGSKLIMHDARAGNLKIGVADNKSLLPHNLARHELFATHLGQNKATAIIETIKQFYVVESTDDLKAYEFSVVMMKDELEGYNYLIDSTASKQVCNYLTLSSLPEGLCYIKSEIADDGQLGLMYAEGPQRNPRMDDLTSYACYLATRSTMIKEWRTTDAGRQIETLNIGLGCSSATSVMPDDLISFHASAFSRVTNSLKSKNDTSQGLIYLSSAKAGDFGPEISNERYLVEPLDVLTCQAGSGWSIRMLAGIREQLVGLCQEHAPVETGGVLIGIANYKTKVIHVFNIITEPQDSHGTCTGFTRGIKGLPEEIDSIKSDTGNVIGYIGEWHTHPMDLKRLSSRDHETIAELKISNRRIPIPTCAIIVTSDDLLAFVYE